jgi:hypothetical protein
MSAIKTPSPQAILGVGCFSELVENYNKAKLKITQIYF